MVPPLSPPAPNSKLVVFVNNRNYVPAYDSEKMLSSAAKYAREYNVWLVPERFLVSDYICLCLIAPDGTPHGLSRACHLNLNYRGSFNRDSSVEPIETPFGKVALLTDVDINMPHVCRGYALKGAELFIASFYMAPYDFSAKRAELCAKNVAESNSIPIAAAIGNGGIIINGDWSEACPFTLDLPAVGKVIPSQWRVDKEAMNTG
ncbi:MAG: hypothetical protein RR315_04150, partial [Oscillospiraceae bacterium]